MKRFFPIASFLRNKFVLAAGAFAVWMLFFDRNNLMEQWQRRNELQDLRESKRFYTEAVKKDRQFLEDLKNDPAFIEKFAREQYGMKRDNEDVFLIKPAGDK